MWLVCENPGTRTLFHRELLVEERTLDDGTVERKLLVGMDAPVEVLPTGRFETTKEVGQALLDLYGPAIRKAKNASDVAGWYVEETEEEAPDGAADAGTATGGLDVPEDAEELPEHPGDGEEE